MKKILILGAGLPQVPLIKKVKSMDMLAVVSSIKGNYPGFEYADKVYYVDTTNQKEIFKIAQDEQIDAIVTVGTDVAIKTIGYICDKLNLTGISFKTATIVTDKVLMKDALIKEGVNTSRFSKVKTLEDAYDACKMIGFPLMFKCVDKSGSRGIVKVVTEMEVEEAYNYAFSFTEKEYIVIEKFIEGVEIGLDGYIGDGTEFFVPYQRTVYNNGHTDIPFGHVLPFGGVSDVVSAKIVNEAKKAVLALGLNRSFFNMDIILTDQGDVFILEVGARIGGAFIPDTIAVYYEFDIYEKIILNALGMPIELPTKGRGTCMSELLISETDGKIQKIEIDFNKINSLGTIVLGNKIGDKVRKFQSGADAIGGIVTKGTNIDDAEKRLSQMKEFIKIIIK